MVLKNTINQTKISFPTVVNVTQGIFMSSLLVAVSSTDNATNITCTVFSSLMINESEPAILLVQGTHHELP